MFTHLAISSIKTLKWGLSHSGNTFWKLCSTLTHIDFTHKIRQTNAINNTHYSQVFSNWRFMHLFRYNLTNRRGSISMKLWSDDDVYFTRNCAKFERISILFTYIIMLLTLFLLKSIINVLRKLTRLTQFTLGRFT